MPQESNKLLDGTLIDLCGATLLWRSAEGLSHSPTVRQLERFLGELNAGRPQCPVGLYTLVVPRKNNVDQVAPESQAIVYLNCGHVQVGTDFGSSNQLFVMPVMTLQGKHDWGDLHDNKGTRTCPICLAPSSTAPLVMGSEPGTAKYASDK